MPVSKLSMHILKSLGAAFLIVMSAACLADDASIELNSTTSEIEEDAHRFGATTDGATTWWVVRRADVANTPDWLPGEEPTLSLAKAVQLAELELPKYTKTPDAYRLDQVDFVPMGTSHINEPRRWFYVVKLERTCTAGND